MYIIIFSVIGKESSSYNTCRCLSNFFYIMRNLLNFHAFGASARYKLECSLYKNVLHFVDNDGLRYKKETLMA